MRGKLFPQICNIKTLWQAWLKVKAKGSSGGIDNITIESFNKNIDKNLSELKVLIEKEQYIPEPLKRIYIPKPGKPDERRAIALPSIKDKIVQEAVRIVIEPLFEKTFLDCSYGYRPGRGPQKAILKVEEYIKNQKLWAASSDIDDFFDSIDKKLLLTLFSKKIWERSIIRLIELWLNMGIIDNGVWAEYEKGIPQGNVLSPLLSNIYLHPFDQEMMKKEVSFVRYVDNFIILASTKNELEEAYLQARSFLLNNLSLKLNYNELCFRHIEEGFVFLGFLFKSNRKCIAESKFLEMQERIRQIFHEAKNKPIEELIKKMNESIDGWRNYYRIGNVEKQFDFLDSFLVNQLSIYLKKQAYKEKIGELANKLSKLEYFKQRDYREKERMAQLIIARATLTEQNASRPSFVKKEAKIIPLTINQAISKKKKEYEKILSKETELNIFELGAFVGKTRRRIVVKLKGKRLLEAPLFRIKRIKIISPGVTISSNIISYCAENGIPIHFLDERGRPYAMIYGPIYPLSKVGINQIEALKDFRGVQLAISFIKSKIKNQINLLKYYSKYRKKNWPSFYQECQEAIYKCKSILEELKNLSKEKDIEKIRMKLFGLEGQVGCYYWGLIKKILSTNVLFEGRERQGATDLVNCLLNYGYGILYSIIYEAILASGLNPNISFLHKRTNGKAHPCF